MSARNMTFYLDLFWVKMHETTAPAVHRASFRPNQAPTPLLLSMVSLLLSALAFYTYSSLDSSVCRCFSVPTLHLSTPINYRFNFILGSEARCSAPPSSGLEQRFGYIKPSFSLSSSESSAAVRRVSFPRIRTSECSLNYLYTARMDHEMAHIFWSSCITLAKRSGLFSQLVVEIPHEKKDDIDFVWRAWIQEEVAKRLAQIMFAVDVERESSSLNSILRF